MLVVLVHVEEGWRGRRDWAAYKTDAERHGVKLDLDDFIPPAIPDAENFAAIPLFQEIFRAESAGVTPTDRFALPPGLPALPDIEKGIPVALTAWHDYFLKNKLLTDPGQDIARDLLRVIDQHCGSALRELRDAGHRPHSRFPVKWKEGYFPETPHLIICRNASRLIALRMTARLATGDSAGAYTDFQDGLNLYRALAREPGLLSGAARISIFKHTQNALAVGLSNHQWAEPELRAIGSDLGKLRLPEDHIFAFASERSATNRRMELLYGRDEFLRLLLANDPSPKVNARLGKMLLSIYPAGWIRQSQVLVNQLYDEELARIDPTRPPGLEPSAEELDARVRGNIVRKLRYSSTWLAPLPYYSARTAYFSAHARNEQAQLACALERFRLSRHAFPKSLEELVPEFISAIPRDVMDGAPMRYRLNDDGSFDLWSIALNRKDDQGAFDPKLRTREQLDWVWRYPSN